MTRDASCPICRKPAGPPSLRPFCSQRCAQVDLGRWLTESYRIPAGPVEPPDGENEAG